MIIIKFLQYHIGVLLRQMYWLYRLSKSHIGKSSVIEFPIIREGKGNLTVGPNSFFGRKLNLGISDKAFLNIGEKAHLGTNCEILINKNCSLTIGVNFKLGEWSRCFVKNDWVIGNNVTIETHCAIFAREPEKSGKLIIGNHSNIGDYTIIDLVDDLIIGNNVAIGPNCTIYTHDHIYTDNTKPAWKGGLISKPIQIEDGAWVGSNVTLLPGIKIGKRSVVAAGSIVTKDVEANCIVGGNPAKLIKQI